MKRRKTTRYLTPQVLQLLEVLLMKLLRHQFNEIDECSRKQLFAKFAMENFRNCYLMRNS